MLAQVLQLRGCLWNSFVMVGSVRAMLAGVEKSLPDLYHAFSSIAPLLETEAEPEAVDRLYQSLPECNFSHQVLARQPETLAVMRVSGVCWNDLGEPKRVFASLDIAGVRPSWIDTAAPQYA